MNKRTILHYSTIAACLMAACGLVTERYLTHMGKSLCHTSACTIAAKFVRFGEPMLLSIGAGFFLLLAGFTLFAGRYASNPFITPLPAITLIAAAAFDGALLGFQFITLRQHCQLCITVGLTLSLVTLLYSASLQRWVILLSVLAAWSAGFTANALVIMPDSTEAHNGMVFYERQAKKQFPAPPIATLIFSMECPHCAEVLNALAKENIQTITWRFAVTDSTMEMIKGLGFFYANLPSTTNPFLLLLAAKESKTTLDKKIMMKFPELTRQARNFLSANGIHAVPVLVYTESTGTITITTGSSEIISFLDSVKTR